MADRTYTLYTRARFGAVYAPTHDPSEDRLERSNEGMTDGMIEQVIATTDRGRVRAFVDPDDARYALVEDPGG